MDLADKIEQADTTLTQGNRSGAFGFSSASASDGKKKDAEGPLAKVARDSSKITSEAVHGLISQVLKVRTPRYLVSYRSTPTYERFHSFVGRAVQQTPRRSAERERRDALGRSRTTIDFLHIPLTHAQTHHWNETCTEKDRQRRG